MKSDKHAVLNRNGSSKHREVGDQMLANKFKEKQPNIETDFWWLNLPYVLVRTQTFSSLYFSLYSYVRSRCEMPYCLVNTCLHFMA